MPPPPKCRLGDEGAQPIFKALMKNTTLQSLNISSNGIGDTAAPVLAEVHALVVS